MASSNRSPWSNTAGPHLDTQISYRLGVPLVYVKGELDHESVPYLRNVIEQELATDAQTLILDFGELSYLDSGGLSLIFDLVQRLRESGWLGVAAANLGVSRLLEMTGLVDHPGFRLFPNLNAASAALAAET